MTDQHIQLQAAEWAMRQQMEALAEADLLALEHWLEADPRHAEALATAEMVWALADELPMPAAQHVPLPARAPAQRPRRRRLARWSALAASLAALFIGSQELPLLLADQHTGFGEVRVLQLDDGSRVHLGSRSALDVRYDGETRRVRLLRGEALFEPTPVGAREARRFIVESRGGRSEALGTRFLVRDEGASTWVGVLEHRVAVSLERQRQRLELEQGQAARYDAGQGVRRLADDPQAAADWSRGVLEFRQVPLHQALQRIGQYRSGLLRLLPGNQAETPVSGLLHLDNLDAGLDRLAEQQGLEVLRLPGLTLLRQARD